MQIRSAIEQIESKYRSLAAVLDERARRHWAATEARAYGWGGVSAVSDGTGMALNTIRKGLAELAAQGDSPDTEVTARLHSDPAFLNRIASQFEGDYRLSYHLAPPLLAKRDTKGQLIKQAFGPWMLTAFRLLAKLKGLRGTALDVFGRTEERKTERALIGEYRSSIEELLPQLSAERMEQAVAIARIPEEIRGYGHVKERHLAAARTKWQQLQDSWRTGNAAIDRAA